MIAPELVGELVASASTLKVARSVICDMAVGLHANPVPVHAAVQLPPWIPQYQPGSTGGLGGGGEGEGGGGEGGGEDVEAVHMVAYLLGFPLPVVEPPGLDSQRFLFPPLVLTRQQPATLSPSHQSRQNASEMLAEPR